MPVEPRSVLLVTPRWTRDGGVATHAMASASALARDGIAVAVLAARVEEEPSDGAITVHHSPRLFDPQASAETRLAGALDSAPEVVHLHQFEDPDLLAVMRRSAPVLISVHGYTACSSGVHYFKPGQECARAHGPGCIPNLTLRGCAHTRNPASLPAAYRGASRGLAAIRGADLAISYSSAVDRHLAANAVERRAVIPLFTTMVAKVGSGHAGRRRVVFAGRVIDAKGASVLIRAASKIDAEVVICGDGWRTEAMRRLARRLGVAERVHFRGWLGPEALAEELAEASIVALPSLWPEPFGLVGIEALAAGRPVIASLTGGVGDWLADGVNGLAVQPGDVAGLAQALDELLGDPARQAALGAAGQAMVAARFSPELHVARLLEAYRSARRSWEAQRERDGAVRERLAPTL
ncbi:MAG TPA: glycosyltransferase family 4 protein [Solirubrobacteraceae bacterium]